MCSAFVGLTLDLEPVGVVGPAARDGQRTLDKTARLGGHSRALIVDGHHLARVQPRFTLEAATGDER